MNVTKMLKSAEKSGWMLTALLTGIRSFPRMPLSSTPKWFGGIGSGPMTQAEIAKLCTMWHAMSVLLKNISYPCLMSGGFAAYLMGDTLSYGDVDIFFAAAINADIQVIASDLSRARAHLVETLPHEIAYNEGQLNGLEGHYPPLFQFFIGDQYQIDVVCKKVTEEQLSDMKKNRYMFGEHLVGTFDMNIVKCIGIMLANGNLIVSRVDCRDQSMEEPFGIKCEKCKEVYPNLVGYCGNCTRVHKYAQRTIFKEKVLSFQQVNLIKRLLTNSFQKI